jgi:hypothetical protein
MRMAIASTRVGGNEVPERDSMRSRPCPESLAPHLTLIERIRGPVENVLERGSAVRATTGPSRTVSAAVKIFGSRP